jgi:hypothetical protein
MGASSGGVPVEICADLMWAAYNLVRERDFADFFALRAALEEQFGDLGPMTARTRPKKSAPAPSPIPAPPPPPSVVPPPPPTPSVKQSDIDFDDT